MTAASKLHDYDGCYFSCYYDLLLQRLLLHVTISIMTILHDMKLPKLHHLLPPSIAGKTFFTTPETLATGFGALPTQLPLVLDHVGYSNLAAFGSCWQQYFQHSLARRRFPSTLSSSIPPCGNPPINVAVLSSIMDVLMNFVCIVFIERQAASIRYGWCRSRNKLKFLVDTPDNNLHYLVLQYSITSDLWHLSFH